MSFPDNRKLIQKRNCWLTSSARLCVGGDQESAVIALTSRVTTQKGLYVHQEKGMTDTTNQLLAALFLYLMMCRVASLLLPR